MERDAGLKYTEGEQKNSVTRPNPEKIGHDERGGVNFGRKIRFCVESDRVSCIRRMGWGTSMTRRFTEIL